MKNVFDANPTANELLVFEDGTCFLNNSQGLNHALNYAKTTQTTYVVVSRKAEVSEEVKEEKTNNKKK